MKAARKPPRSGAGFAKYSAVAVLAFAFGRQWDATFGASLLEAAPRADVVDNNSTVELAPASGIMDAATIADAESTVDVATTFRPPADPHLQPLDCLALLERYSGGDIPQLAKHTAELPYHMSYVRLTSTAKPFYVATHDARVDRIRARLFNEGEYYETAMTSAVESILEEESAQLGGRRRPLVVDVGGNIGWFSLLSAAHGAEVITFEPNVVNMVRYCESAVLNRFVASAATEANRIHPFLAGVGNDHGARKSMRKVETNNPGSFTFSEGVGRNKEELEGGALLLVTLDALAQDQGWLDETDDDSISPIALLKIDVEGLEMDVLRGAEKLLKGRKARNVFLEFKYAGKPMTDMCAALLEAGYRLHKVGDSKGPTELVTERYDSAERLAEDIRSKKWGTSHENVWFRRAADS